MSKNALIGVLVVVLLVVVGILIFYKAPVMVVENVPVAVSTTTVPVVRPASAPTVKTEDAVGVLRLAAKLNGTINPNGFDTTYWFEFGETASLGKVTATQSAGIGMVEIEVSSPATPLSSNTKYYFRINAQNRFGTVNGSILSFTTK